MKKVILAVILAIGLMSISSTPDAADLSETYVIRNNTSDVLETAVSTSTIVPGIHRIVGYNVRAILGSGMGAWVTLYRGGTAQSDIMGESEALEDTTDGEVFGYPKAVREGGLRVYQSAYSNVFIEYSR